MNSSPGGTPRRRPWWPLGRRQAAAVRTVDVVPPSESDEGSVVFLTASFIVLVMIYVYAFEHFGIGQLPTTQSAQASLLPYQVLFRDLPSEEQRVFRKLQEGVGEIVQRRSDTGTWPAVAALATEGIPPFARDPIDLVDRRWTLRRDGLVLNYLGVPVTPGPAPAFLIFIQEPDPVTGERATQGDVDEEHQLLANGRLLHVTYWMRAGLRPGERSGTAGPQADPGVIAGPAEAGWQQIRVRTIFEELEESS